MSVSDPLLKELKGYALKLTQESLETPEITDENLTLQPLCQTLEKIFQKGLTVRNNISFVTELPESWIWLHEISFQMEQGYVERNFKYMRAVEHVVNCPKVMTSLGQLRLLIRHCLMDKCLHIPVEIFVRDLKNCHNEYYNQHKSILGDDILGEIFLSVILQCSSLCFKLNVNNSRFLDISWLLPDCVSLQFVPCDRLGISISFIQNKAIVVNVEDGCVAAEDDKVEVGDVLDELNNNILTTSTKGKLYKIMLQMRYKPITCSIIKAHYFKCGDIYSPLIHLLRKTNIDPDVLRRRYIQHQPQPLSTQLPTAGYKVTYIGNRCVGKEGDVKQIEPVVVSLLARTLPVQQHVPAYFECLELGVRVTNGEDGKELLNKSYMEISSCGQIAKYPTYFAYIAGSGLCNECESFTCYVFHCEQSCDIETILHSIGQGFQRTHFIV